MPAQPVSPPPIPCRPALPRHWSIVLAAGSGKRLGLITGGVPKQFWRREQEPTLLEQTIERMGALVPRWRTVLVVAESHRPHVEGMAEALRNVQLVWQPQNRGTACGIALGVLPILERDPDAIVVVTPSDHGVAESTLFVDGLRTVIQHVGARGGLVVCGVEPTASTDDYGWIVPDGALSSSAIRGVSSFHEKPDPIAAAALYACGAVWNTMIVAARARTLFDTISRQAPAMARVFERALTIGPTERQAFLTNAYASLPSVDFSRDVLARSTNLTTYVWPASVRWTDLGTPERLTRWWHTSELHSPAAPRQPARLPRAHAAGRPLADETARCIAGS